jgi:hypothetical protein
MRIGVKTTVIRALFAFVRDCLQAYSMMGERRSSAQLCDQQYAECRVDERGRQSIGAILAWQFGRWEYIPIHK